VFELADTVSERDDSCEDDGVGGDRDVDALNSDDAVFVGVGSVESVSEGVCFLLDSVGLRESEVVRVRRGRVNVGVGDRSDFDLSSVADADMVAELLVVGLRDSLNSRLLEAEWLVDLVRLISLLLLGVTLTVRDLLSSESVLSLLAVTDDESTFERLTLGTRLSVSEGTLDSETVKEDSLLSVPLGSCVGECVLEGERLPTVRFVVDLVVLTSFEGDAESVFRSVGVSDASGDSEIVSVGPLTVVETDC
jgi:hypothetical protein